MATKTVVCIDPADTKPPFLHLLQIFQTWLLKVTRRTGASPGADGRLGHHGGVCGLQKVHHWHYRIQQAQPVAGHQESSPKTQDPVLLHVLTQGEGGLPALWTNNQGDLELFIPFRLLPAQMAQLIRLSAGCDLSVHVYFIHSHRQEGSSDPQWWTVWFRCCVPIIVNSPSDSRIL